MNENLELCVNQISLARTEIKNLRQQISALKHEHIKEIKVIKSTLEGLRCASCGDAATTVTTNHHKEPSTSSSGDGIPFKPIGHIETPFLNKRGVPRQPTVMANAQGALVIDTAVFNNPEHALAGLEEFSHIWILFHFHATDSNSIPAKVAPPRLSGERRGVFSTRSPHRPSPIGLSLVKIQSIEGNRINFLGVDMVNGTPVLDIKPYIPQYDYPATFAEPLPELTRPPTEGISDATDAVVNLTLDNESTGARSLSPRMSNSIGIDTNSPSRSPFEDMPSPGTNILTPISPSSESPPSEDLLRTRTLLRRPDTERGAPDGQERFTPPQSAQLNLNDGIRVASWISNPPAQVFEVRFTDDALNRLNDLIGDRAQTFKANLESLLSEDPRSHYVKTRYPEHEYNCVLEDLSISCIFDSNSSVCTIIALRSAEEMQDN